MPMALYIGYSCRRGAVELQLARRRVPQRRRDLVGVELFSEGLGAAQHLAEAALRLVRLLVLLVL